jgi:hypothetical protein
MLGAWDVAVAERRHEAIASGFWRDKIWVVDSETLAPKRSFDIAPCVRPVGYDPVHDLGLTVECFSGYLIAFDLDTGATRDRRYVGQNARKIESFEGYGTVVLSGCGVIRLA